MDKPVAKPRILVVDDVPENVRMLLETLRDEYAAIPALSGKDALKKAQIEPLPDLILLDIIMPDMDGYQVIEALKTNPTTKQIPVIFITTIDDIMDEAKAFKKGAVDYITKPFNPITVKARVKTHVTLKRYSDHLEDVVAARTLELQNTMLNLIKAKQAAEAANKAKSHFLANMSHELRTPMNGILASIDLLSIYEIDPEMKEIHEIISDSGNALLTLIDNILTFSKPKEAQFELYPECFDINDLFASLKTSFFHKGEKKEITLQIEHKTRDLPGTLIGDIHRLAEVFNNLIDNAVKFSTGKPMVTIGVASITNHPEYKELEFYVRDNGIGIDPQDHDMIFQPFTQVDTSMTRQYDGAGIGLAACRRIIEQMNGEIWVKSELGQSSTFYFKVQLN